MSGNFSDWLSYVGRALKKVANTAGSTVCHLSVGLIPYLLGTVTPCFLTDCKDTHERKCQ